jgi:hypothetical protein
MSTSPASTGKKFVLRPGGILPEGITEEELKIRWYPQETQALQYLKSELRDELSARNSSVDSDARMMRFIRKHSCDPVGATENYREHLIWRKKENADKRHDLMISDNLDPSTVPNGKRVVELMPQMPCSFELCDKLGNPISIEYYGFNPGMIEFFFLLLFLIIKLSSSVCTEILLVRKFCLSNQL